MAQTGGNYTITSSAVAGGGAVDIDGGSLNLKGTIGQSGAGTPKASSNFAQIGGYWQAGPQPLTPGMTFTVTKTADTNDGVCDADCSLREAITAANANLGLDTIAFHIGTGLQTISPTSSLPSISDPVVVNGTTQPGFAGSPLIELDGVKAGDVICLIITAGNSTIRGLIIHGYRFSAIQLATKGNNLIAGNYIGTNAAGTDAYASAQNNGIGILVNTANNVIGGTTPADRNIVSGNKNQNGSSGIWLQSATATGNKIIGNYIGTDVTGTVPILQYNYGILCAQNASGNFIGGLTLERNIITSSGAAIGLNDTFNNKVMRNSIGVGTTGASLNTTTGIQLVGNTHDNVIGGTNSGDGNLIAFITGKAIWSQGTLPVRNAFLGNNIFSNAFGIDLGNNGLTPNDINDVDSGANNLQNFPLLTSATPNAGSTAISGTLNSVANTQYRVEVFANTSCNASGNGEGKIYLGATTATLVGNDGNFNFTTAVDVQNKFLTATATDPAGNTSEFSPCFLVGNPGMTITDVSKTEGNSGTTSFVFDVKLSSAANQTITANYSTVAGGTATLGNDYQPTSGQVTFVPGQTTQSFTVLVNGDAQDEQDETFFVELSNAVNANIQDAQGKGTILNDDSGNTTTVQFSQATYNVQEDLGAITVTVNRTGDTSAASSVSYATNDDVAKQRADFEYAGGTLKFAPGETSKTFLILFNEDMYVEGSEEFLIVLSDPVGTVLGQQSTSSVIITDDTQETTTNPIDNAQSFVYMQYHDFLNREPDPSGLAFWTNEINSCGADQSCIETKRTNVSAAFFLSIEFQETGYLVYRTHKAAWGSLPDTPVPVRLTDFLADTQQISRGVIVNQAGWQQVLENNKQAFMVDFVSRELFAQEYPSSMTPGEFVDVLFHNADVVPTTTERNDAIAEFGNAVNTSDIAARARVLRRIAENPVLTQQEFNRAFVLMQYFGYLRRNPNEDPEPGFNYDGYNFWLNKLNAFNGNYVNAEMVKAFILSSEYRQRFGQ